MIASHVIVWMGKLSELCLEYVGHLKLATIFRARPSKTKHVVKMIRGETNQRRFDDLGWWDVVIGWLPHIKEDVFCGRFSQGHYPEGFQQRACCAWKLSLWKISATLPIYLPLPINQPPTTTGWIITWWFPSEVLFDGGDHRFSSSPTSR